MNDFQGMLYTIEIICTVMFWIGMPIFHQDLLLFTGVNPNGEAMMKIIHLKGNLDVFKGPIMNHTIRLMVSGTMRLTCTRSMISSEIAIPAWKIMVIEDMINLLGLLGLTVVIMHMMIMGTSPVFLLIIVGRVAMRGIMITIGIVMILIMKEVPKEIVIGSDAIPAIENETRKVLAGKKI